MLVHSNNKSIKLRKKKKTVRVSEKIKIIKESSRITALREKGNENEQKDYWSNHGFSFSHFP